MSYEPMDKILFTGDAFGGFGTLDGGIFDDALDIDYFEDEILRTRGEIYASIIHDINGPLDRHLRADSEIITTNFKPVRRIKISAIDILMRL
jgi:flavorubredoxin